MANIDAGNGDWLRWSDDAPLTSETGDDRERATLKVINECSKPLHVQWVTSDGKLKPPPRRARASGRYAILDNSVKNEHTEGTLVGDAFVIYAGLEETPPETIGERRHG